MACSRYSRYIKLLLILISIITIAIPLVNCSADLPQESMVINKIHRTARPYSFDFLAWETREIPKLLQKDQPGKSDSSLQSELSRRITEVLSDYGINTFPPLNFRLDEPPHLLIISPREKIMYLDRLMLRQDLTPDEKQDIEAQCDALGVSSLVDDLGGFAAIYPPIISDRAKLPYIINAAIEEWFHQYLAFKPLGFLYILDSTGISQSPDIAAMNETLAGIVSKEVGDEVLKRYYTAGTTPPTNKDSSGFNYNAEMKETRRQVDIYLSQEKIDAAERYMEERRQLFVSYGYQIRKLNQAYFAFHGIYGHDPASVSPLNQELKQLRTKSLSLKDFIDTVSAMTSHNDLQKALVP
jgi:hypothetical protein